MKLYCLYLFADGHIFLRQDFLAENDEIATGIAAVVADGCSEQCEKFELWDGTRIVLNDLSLRAQEIRERAESAAARTKAQVERTDSLLESLRESIETSAVVLEESAISANGALSRSQKLNARLAELRKKQP